MLKMRSTYIQVVPKFATFLGRSPDTDTDKDLRHLAPLRRREWVVYAKRPFAGPAAAPAGPSVALHARGQHFRKHAVEYETMEVHIGFQPRAELMERVGLELP